MITPLGDSNGKENNPLSKPYKPSKKKNTLPKAPDPSLEALTRNQAFDQLLVRPTQEYTSLNLSLKYN